MLLTTPLVNGAHGDGLHALQELTQGWFTTRLGDEYYLVYRNSGGGSGIVYGCARGQYDDGESTVTLASESLASDTWKYTHAAIGACGSMSDYSVPLSITVTGTSMDPAIGNDPHGIKVKAIKGGRFRVKWMYQRRNQEVQPDGFNVYAATTKGGAETLVGRLMVSRYRRIYSIITTPLTAGQTYFFRVLPFVMDKDIVLNGDCEVINDTTLRPDNWLPHGAPTNWYSSTSIKYEGSVSVGFTSTSGNGGIANLGVALTSGKEYYCSAWVYPDDATEVRVSVGSLGSQYDNTFTGLTQDEWNLVSFNFTASTSSAVECKFLYTAGSQTGTWYIDLLHFFETMTEKQNYNYVKAIADTTGPTAVTPITVEVLP